MKLGLMQPYFFPYLGYFQLIQAVDRFIFFDTTQYVRRGWISRNRIINIKDGTTYITVPVVKSPRGTAIMDIVPCNSTTWRESILSQLDVYRKLSSRFLIVKELVENIIYSDFQTISQLNINSVTLCLEYLGIHFKHDIFSEMKLKIPYDASRDEWALNITKALEYDVYVNLPGGRELYCAKKFLEKGISLKFVSPNLPVYEQKIGRFEPGLSIIDVLMFNEVDEARKLVSDYSLSS